MSYPPQRSTRQRTARPDSGSAAPPSGKAGTGNVRAGNENRLAGVRFPGSKAVTAAVAAAAVAFTGLPAVHAETPLPPAGSGFRFDFGPGATADGYTQVNASQASRPRAAVSSWTSPTATTPSS